MAAMSLIIVMALQGMTLERRIIRAAPAGEDAAAYVAIMSPAGEDRLIGVDCACAERVEIHRIVRGNGDVSMRAEPSLSVPAAGIEIRPGSDLHLMVMGLRAPLAAGQSVPMTLRFELAGAVTARFAVVADSAAGWQAAQAATPALAPELQPLAFLVDSCFRGTFPGTTRTDTHCYTVMPGGRQIRDVHIVEGAPSPYGGEAIYRWDARSRTIRYDYYASDGGYSSGTAVPNATGIDYPQENYVGGNGTALTLRNTLTRDGDGYRGRSEMQRDGTWREMWTMRFARIGPASAR